MKFSVFVAPKAVKSDLAATTKEEVIAELVQSLVEAQEILAKDKDDIIKAIMRREELGSTGIGRGVAVPHTKHPSVKKLVGTVGVSSQGLDFESEFPGKFDDHPSRYGPKSRRSAYASGGQIGSRGDKFSVPDRTRASRPGC